MEMTRVDVDAELLARARELTGEKSNRAVLVYALRRLIAGRQKSEMLRGILELTHLPQEYGVPVRKYPAPDDA